MFECQRDTCMDHLTWVLNKTVMEECKEFIKRVRETKHKNILQTAKYETLCQKIQVATQILTTLKISLPWGKPLQ